MIAAYTRVSTDEQNLETQRRVIRDWLALRDLEAEWFEDKGYSGDTLHRPGFKALRKRDAELSCVVVFRLDRLSRKTAEGVTLLHAWLDRGVRVVSVMESVDLDPADPHMSHMIANIIVPILFGLGANEQSVRRQRQLAGIKRAKQEGVYQGRKAGTLKASPSEAQKLRKRGLSSSEIGRLLGVSRRSALRYLKAQPV